MPRFAQVVAKSNLIQLDREFDFLIPEQMQGQIKIGQQVTFPFGRAKKLQTGFVVGVSDQSEYATSELSEIQDSTPVLSPELLAFCRQVADRQCAALGEILATAIPDHMARTPIPESAHPLPPEAIGGLVPVAPDLSKRSALLSTGRPIEFAGQSSPDWAAVTMVEASKRLSERKSVIVIAPEQSDLDNLRAVARITGLEQYLIEFSPNLKRSDRYKAFHACNNQEFCLVIGTRSAIYAPAKNLGLVVLYDDLDESLREQGSPFTHGRELALMHAGKEVDLLFISPYRSVEIQRLVELGYLSDHDTVLPAPRISFTEPGARLDETGFKLIRERLEHGAVLILLPRKGSSAALYCANCGERLRCNCGGMIWEPGENRAICRICNKPNIKCEKCKAPGYRRGRTGSSRTVSELGKVFPQVAIAEATAEKRPSGLKTKRQIVVATPSSAPAVPGGYAGVLILDADIWLSRQSLNAEAFALRDWMGAVELCAPDGRVVLSGVDRELGQAFAMQQHRQLAKTQLAELRSLGLPPATRVATIETEPEHLEAVLEIAKSQRAKVLRVDAETGSVLLSFGYQQGPELAKSLRAFALTVSARMQGAKKRRGVRIVMDDPNAL